MTRTLDFHKIGRSWYADVPDWKGKLEDLEMVMGADTLLDVLSKRGRFVRVLVSDHRLQDSIHLHSNREIYEGTEYTPVDNVSNEVGMIGTLWLCQVNNFFWGCSENDKAPEDIYFKVIQYV